MKYLTIKNENDVNTVSAILHDAWFDAGKIKLDATKEIASILFAYNQKTLQKEICDVILIIENVKNYELNDTEQIGFYDLNKIEWNQDKQSLKFVCNIPLYLEFFRK
jgi:hypothetical protein